PVGQHRGEQRTLAVDSLIAYAGDLLGEPLEQRIVDLRRVVPGHSSTLLDPHLAWPVDEQFSDVGLPEPAAKRLQIGFEERIDAFGLGKLCLLAHPAAPSPDEKIRSRAVNTRIGSPWRTLIVGPRLPSRWIAAEAALWPPPTMTVDAPPVASVLAPPRTDSRIAEPKREKKWVLT